MCGQLQRTYSLQGIEQLLDRRLAQLGIGRVRHLSFRHQLNPQCPFRCQRQLVFRGLAIDEELRTTRLPVRNLRSLAIALFTHQEQQPNVDAAVLQLFGSTNLRRDNALGVA